jgi:hypothetical protein
MREEKVVGILRRQVWEYIARDTSWEDETTSQGRLENTIRKI